MIDYFLYICHPKRVSIRISKRTIESQNVYFLPFLFLFPPLTVDIVIPQTKSGQAFLQHPNLPGPEMNHANLRAFPIDVRAHLLQAVVT